MKVLVTGGNGFIGSHVVMRLLKEDHLITIVDHQPVFVSDYVKSKVHFMQLGAEDPKCERLFSDALFDVVIHLAYHTPAFEIDDSEMHWLHVNQGSLSNILYLSQKYHVHKVIVLSSYEVYGRQDHIPVGEDAVLRPYSLAGHHQQTRELLCSEYRHRGLDVVVLRPACVFGPLQKDYPDSIFKLSADNRITPGLMPWDDPMIEKIDYIYISDLVEAIILAAGKVVPPVMNVSSGDGVSRQELLDLCKTVLDSFQDEVVPAGDGQPAETPAPGLAQKLTLADVPLSEVMDPRVDEATFSRHSYILGNRRVSRELGWQPKYSLEEGIARTLAWMMKADDNPGFGLPTDKPAPVRKKFWSRSRIHMAEVAAFGGLAFTLDFLLQRRLGFPVDVMLLYVALVCLFYGFRQGWLSIVWAAAGRIILRLAFERQPFVTLALDNNLIMQVTMYLILGVFISYTIDARMHQQDTLRSELGKARQELTFVNLLYQKSLEVKNNLQFTIENSANSLGKLIHLISRLERSEQGQAYDEVANIFADVLKVSHVHVYCSDSTGHRFRLISSVGESTYSKSIETSQFEFLSDVVKNQRIFINRELKPDYPQVCAPIFFESELEAVVFIDGIEFKSLTQHFINTLKSLSVLISESIERKHRYESLVHNDKYISNTFILKQPWFEKSIQEKLDVKDKHILLLKVNNEIYNYKSFNRIINNLIRSVDSVGEIAKGRLGIILIDAEEKYLPIIQARFSEKGFSVDLMRFERQTEEKIS